jgi:hypothetical protein
MAISESCLGLTGSISLLWNGAQERIAADYPGRCRSQSDPMALFTSPAG